MSRKTKAVLIAENEHLRSRLREIHAAYHDTHKAWEQAEKRCENMIAARDTDWLMERMQARIDGLLDQIAQLKSRKKKKALAKV